MIENFFLICVTLLLRLVYSKYSFSRKINLQLYFFMLQEIYVNYANYSL